MEEIGKLVKTVKAKTKNRTETQGVLGPRRTVANDPERAKGGLRCPRNCGGGGSQNANHAKHGRKKDRLGWWVRQTKKHVFQADEGR